MEEWEVLTIQFESFEQLADDQEQQKRYRLQCVNDLLEQIERLKKVDTSTNQMLQICISLTIKALYETLQNLL